MSHQDPIADLFTRIRNAQRAGHKTVGCPSSKIKMEIARVLKEEGYITNYHIENTDGKASLQVELKYYKDRPVIEKIKRVSKPGLRVYKKSDNITKVISGLGIKIISTSKGVMSDRAARAASVGGEIIGEVA